MYYIVVDKKTNKICGGFDSLQKAKQSITENGNADNYAILKVELIKHWE